MLGLPPCATTPSSLMTSKKHDVNLLTLFTIVMETPLLRITYRLRILLAYNVGKQIVIIKEGISNLSLREDNDPHLGFLLPSFLSGSPHPGEMLKK